MKEYNNENYSYFIFFFKNNNSIFAKVGIRIKLNHDNKIHVKNNSSYKKNNTPVFCFFIRLYAFSKLIKKD